MSHPAPPTVYERTLAILDDHTPAPPRPAYPYEFRHSGPRRGKLCRKLGPQRPAQSWVQVEFEDGTTAVIPAAALRRRNPSQ